MPSTHTVRRAALATALCLAALLPASAQSEEDPATKPTIVLVHGAFADSSSWAGVVPGLEHEGYRVIAAANPLRSLKGDAAYVSDLLASVPGPVVLVGHSYGGSVITDAAVGHANVHALVYVAGLAPDAGESAFDLVGKFPGSTLGTALKAPVTLASGVHDLYVDPAKYAGPFAADLPAASAEAFAAAQRPVTDVALKEPSGIPAWKTVPAWFVYGSADQSIPPQVQAFMAKRAHAKQVVVVPGASHLVMVSHPRQVERLIEEAAAGTTR